MEQLNECKDLQASTTQAVSIPQVPLLMQAYNVTNVNDFLLETVRKIRPR